MQEQLCVGLEFENYFIDSFVVLGSFEVAVI